MKLGWPEILLILVVVIIIFGVGKLPEVGGAIGKGIRNFKKSASGEDEQKQTTSEAKKVDATKTEKS